MKRIAVFGICFILVICGFTGCAPELHERLLIRAVGIDSMDSMWQVTIRASDPGESGKEISFTEKGGTVAEALQRISQSTGKKPLYSHNALIIFGRACAEQGLTGCLDFFLRHYDSRPTVKVLLADGMAEEILAISSDEQNPLRTNDIAALIKSEVYSGTTVDADLITLINGTYGPNQSAVLPIIVKNDLLKLDGAGVLRNMRLCAELDSEALRGYLVLTGKLSAGETVFENETCGTVTISTNDCDCTINFTGTKDNPRFTVKAEIGGEISSISSGKTRLERDVFPQLENQYASVIAQNIGAYLDSVVFSTGSDTVGFGRIVLWEDPAVWQAVSGDLSEFLKNAQIDIQVNAQIDRVEEEDTPYL